MFIIYNLKFKIAAGFILAFYLFCNSAMPILATMSSPDYQLQLPTVEVKFGKTTTTPQNLYPPKPVQRRAQTPNSTVSLGSTFSFALSNNAIDLGGLSAGIPTTAATTLSVSASDVGGYQVMAQENHQLMIDNIGALIPDTSGDEGKVTEKIAGLWKQNTTFGFGYTMYGDDILAPFPTKKPFNNYYKQFADISKGETPEVIMQSASGGKNRNANIGYKVITSASQSAGRYQNIITYTAIPSY